LAARIEIQHDALGSDQSHLVLAAPIVMVQHSGNSFAIFDYVTALKNVIRHVEENAGDIS
jgi:hypothetical protein